MTATIPREELARDFAEEYVVMLQDPGSAPEAIGILIEGDDNLAITMRREEALAVAARINRLACELPPQPDLVVPDRLVQPITEAEVKTFYDGVERSDVRPLRRRAGIDDELRDRDV